MRTHRGMAVGEIVRLHREWLESGGVAGVRADLKGADLSGAEMEGVNLAKAHLQGALLEEASLCQPRIAPSDSPLAARTEATYAPALRKAEQRNCMPPSPV